VTPERWRQIKDVLADALDRQPGERSRYVAEACGDDAELKQEIESLIQAEARDVIPSDPSPPLPAPQRLPHGARLGPYQISSLLGAGGMGEVYRARDTKLQREVAIKILPHAFTADPERLARFGREARLLAALNHPNIGAIYGFEETAAGASGSGASVHGLVLELVEGETLAQKIGRLSIDAAVGIARQVADALDAAHEKGIVHRDLKPANIKVTAGGVVKVLDFGLAKATAASDPALPDADRSTTTDIGTGEGMVLGTHAYMSPEQARGRAVDKRADVWAFGCVLYEMLAGRPAFARDTVTDTLAAIVDGEPDWTRLPAALAPRLRRLLARCLDKDPRRRLRDIGDARMELDAADDLPPAPARRRPGLAAWAAAGAGGVAALALAVSRFHPVPDAAAPPIRFAVSPPAGVRLSANTHQFVPTLSPDGRRLAFAAVRGGSSLIWVRSLDSLEAQPLPGTESATYPFWSPDSRRIGFFAAHTLKTVDVAGGPVYSVCESPAFPLGGTWGRQDVIVFAAGSLFSVPAQGGSPSPLPAGEGRVRSPAFLPDGRRFLYWTTPHKIVWMGSLDSSQYVPLLNADSPAIYASGSLLFVRQGTLIAQPFDAARGKPTGVAAPVAEQVMTNLYHSAAFSASDTGTLVYRTGTLAVPTQLTWVDRHGKPLRTVGRPGPYRNPALSPDGTRVALEVTDLDRRTQDVWVMDLGRDAAARLTFDVHNEIFPVWSPDGAWIMYGSDRDGVFNLYQRRANGTGEEELVLRSPLDMVPNSWAPDGGAVVYRTIGQNISLGILPLVGPRTPRSFLPTTQSVTTGMVSPDGRWLAYHSFEGTRQVYVQGFPAPEGGKWQISKDGGTHARWRADGREIFYYGLDGRLMAVPIVPGAAIEWSPPVPLFQTPLLNGTTTSYGYRQQYDVAPDGRALLLNLPVEDDSPTAITVVVNWARPDGR
jgi:Tol biopolymer transport system component